MAETGKGEPTKRSGEEGIAWEVSMLVGGCRSSRPPSFDDLISFRYAIQYWLWFNQIQVSWYETFPVDSRRPVWHTPMRLLCVKPLLNLDNSNIAIFDVQSSLVDATRIISSIVLWKVGTMSFRSNTKAVRQAPRLFESLYIRPSTQPTSTKPLF